MDLTASGTKAPRQLVLTGFALTVALFLMLVLRRQALSLTLTEMEELGTGCAALALFAAGRAAHHSVYSGGFLYVLTLTVFHLGLAILATVRLPFDPRYQAYIDSWYRVDNHAVEALYLSSLAVLTFAVVYFWATVRWVGRSDATPTPSVVADPGLLGMVGAALIISGATLFLGYIAVTAPSILLGSSYSGFDQTVAGRGPVSVGMEMVAIGAAIAAAAPRSRSRRVGLAVLVVFGILVLGMGSRTAVMYAGTGLLASAARMHRMPRRRTAALGMLAVLIGIGVIAQVRDSSHGEPVTAANISVVPALTEMGGSLRPVVETLKWRHDNQEGPYDGLTYAAGPLRVYERIVGIPRPDPDMRFASTITEARVSGYNIGYSVVAEAYLNFNTAGVVGLFALLGWLLGRADNVWRPDAYAAARVGVLMFVLSYEVRQASNIVLTLLLAGMAVVAATQALGKARASRAALAAGGRGDDRDLWVTSAAG